MTVQSQDGGNVTVLLTPSTQVEEPQGIFREKHLSMTISYNAQNQLVADDVKFSGSALKTAEDIQAGLTPTQEQALQNQKQIQAEQQKLQQQQHDLQVEEQKTAANKRQLRRPTSASESWATTTSWERSPFFLAIARLQLIRNINPNY